MPRRRRDVYAPDRKSGRAFNLFVRHADLALYEEAARLAGHNSLAEWMRTMLRFEALRTLIAARNVPCRLRPGHVVWAVRRAPQGPVAAHVEPLFAAAGDERAWVVDLVEDAPDIVSSSGRGFLIDLVGRGVTNALVRDEAIEWRGAPPPWARVWPLTGGAGAAGPSSDPPSQRDTTGCDPEAPPGVSDEASNTRTCGTSEDPPQAVGA